MIDEMFDRTYQAGRAELHCSLSNAFNSAGNALGNAFKVLNRIEYNAPWATPRKTVSRV